MLNDPACVPVPLSVFAGNNDQLDPTDLPAGLSWGSRDVAFLPGQVFTRPPFQQYATRAGSSSQAVYTHDYVKPDGTVSRIDCYADGAILCDGAVIGQTTPGNRFHAVTCFGKVFIASSDGLHGTDVPLKYDGTYIDRVSQDGPGDTCSLANYSLPLLQLVAGSTGTSVAVSTAVTINPQTVQVGGGYGPEEPYYPGGGGMYTPPTYETYYTALQVTTSTAHGLVQGESVTLSGNSAFNQSGYVESVIDLSNFTLGIYTQTYASGTGGTITSSAPFLQRSSNIVTAATSLAHNVRAGYEVSIAGVTDQTVGGSVASITIDNTAHPGLARIVTTTAHGLSPAEDVSLSGVADSVVGGGIVSIVHQNGVATLTTTTAHGLQVGARVLVQSGGPAVPFTVSSVTSTTVFSYTDGVTGATQTGGTLTVVWPGNQATTQEYTVDTVDSPTSFFVPLSYSNGTWTGGLLTYAWNGTYFVTAVPSATTFQYRQNGPDMVLTTGSGTAVPQGQISAGQRTAVVSFQTRSGYVTKPSVKVSVEANGGKYLFVSNLPIGPANTVARIISLTGADGGNFFYIAAAPRDPAGGFLIGTSTVVPDNTTTSAILDFSDESLFAGISIDIPGNNLFGLEVLGPCMGFANYASRLAAWGDTNRVQQFRNMGFEGGTYAGAPNAPLGWTTAQPGTLLSGDFGSAWQITGAGTGTDGKIAQSAYLDAFGAPLIKPQTQYTFRLWLKGGGLCRAILYSPSLSTLATADVVATAQGGWAQANFDNITPTTLPSDLSLVVFGYGLATGQTLIIDELQMVYTQNPQLLTARFSYVNSPESFHGETGKLGIADFPLPIMSMSRWRGSLCLLTGGPRGELYETSDSQSGEPSSWDIERRGAMCGVNSVWGSAEFEDWFVWASDTGLRIYDGSGVDKISQEIEAWWDTINPAAKQFMAVANDPYTRRLYVVAPVGAATVNNAMQVLDYRELNTAGLLTSSGTLRVGYSGKMVTTDLTRKWTQWSATMHYCGMVSAETGDARMVFCGGDGASAVNPLHGAIYSLNEGSLAGADADYGPFWQSSVYPTYFFVGADEAQGLHLGVHRLLHCYATMNVSGNGAVVLKAAVNRPDNVTQTTRAVAISEDLARDLEFPLWVKGERVSYIIGCQPVGLSNQAGFRVSSLIIAIKTDPHAPVRGRNG